MNTKVDKGLFFSFQMILPAGMAFAYTIRIEWGIADPASAALSAALAFLGVGVILGIGALVGLVVGRDENQWKSALFLGFVVCAVPSVFAAIAAFLAAWVPTVPVLIGVGMVQVAAHAAFVAVSDIRSELKIGMSSTWLVAYYSVWAIAIGVGVHAGVSVVGALAFGSAVILPYLALAYERRLEQMTYVS